MNFADRDPVLRPLLESYLAPDDYSALSSHIDELGEIAGTELDELAMTADKNPPFLRPYSADGTRIDEVVYHPAYERMCELAYEKFGLAAMSHRSGVFGWNTPLPHLVKYAVSYLFVQSEFGLACPVSMTDSAARVLRLFDPDNFGLEIDALSSTDPETRASGAMFMTERQAGTDIGKTETIATERDGEWTLSGKKWFCSNVSADVILTLAQVPGQGTGTRGLGMFMVPRLRPDGTRNSYTIDRLKDKLGTKSMASGEVTMEDTYARPVGDLTRGFLQMAEMLNVSRLSNAMRASALMRRSVREAVDHSRSRYVFGKPLFEQPLMRSTILPLLVDAEASLGMVFEAANQLDAADAGDPVGGALIRILTPMAKHTICKRARFVSAEAMEVRGGNGYIEDWIDPRLVRDSHLGSIWEGSSNVIALDVLRCMRKDNGHKTAADTFTSRLDALDEDSVAPAAELLRTEWQRLAEHGDHLLAADSFEQQAGMSAYVDDMCHAVMATLLLEQAAAEIRGGRGYRKLLVAHTYLHKMTAHRLVNVPALRALEAIADGGDVDKELAIEAFEAIGTSGVKKEGIHA